MLKSERPALLFLFISVANKRLSSLTPQKEKGKPQKNRITSNTLNAVQPTTVMVLYRRSLVREIVCGDLRGGNFFLFNSVI